MADRQRRQSLRLDKRGARAVLAGHPWVFQGALDRADLQPQVGAEIDLLDDLGAFIARGLAEGPTVSTGPALRVFTRDRRDPELGKLLNRRLGAARRLRERCLPPETTGFRLLNGEGDGLPGLVIDRYAGLLVVRPDGDLWTPHLRALVAALRNEGGRGIEGVLLKPKRGDPRLLDGVAPPEELTFCEDARRYLVRPAAGQKTGFFLDQRPNRSAVQRLAGSGDRCLNLFSYTGGFSVAMALGGAAQVTSVDLSAPILADCERQLLLNGLDPAPHELVAADLFRWLPQQRRERAGRYDLIVCDPPALAHKAADLPKARRAYRQLHEHLGPLLKRGGLLVTASCTSRLGPADLLEDVQAGLRQADRRVSRVLREAGAGEDHPVPPGFPQGRYLSCLTLVVD